jgi:DNA-binding transcriptional ArsR family regulator
MGERSASSMNEVFGAMADPTRRAILARLTKGSARVTELASEFPISLNSTSKHIRMLERAGLVRRDVVGRDHFLSLDAKPLARAADLLESFRPFWEEKLEALERYITTKRGRDRADKEKR